MSTKQNTWIITANTQTAESILSSRHIAKLPYPCFQGKELSNLPRLDYFLIWGHGFEYTATIAHALRVHPDVDILSFTRHHITNITKFVFDLYSCDTYPIEHLIAKTRYLLKTPPDIAMFVVRNRNPKVRWAGSGPFRGVQCDTITQIKNSIRDTFNPRLADDRRSEYHVVHASDYESQTAHALMLLQLRPLAHYRRDPIPAYDLAYCIPTPLRYRVIEIAMAQLYTRLADGVIVSVPATPHYQYAIGNPEPYCEYFGRYGGIVLKQDHFPDVFGRLMVDFKYDYITTDGRRPLIAAIYLPKSKIYCIADGVHRAAILAARGNRKVTILELDSTETENNGNNPNRINRNN